MTLVFACIAPHGGLVFDQPEAPTRQGMEELGRRFTAAEPEAAIVLTPHGVHVDGHFAVVRSAALEGDASQWTTPTRTTAAPASPELADACVRALQADGLPALGITFGATARGRVDVAARLGRAIPLWFMRAPAVVVSPSRASRTTQHVRAGAALARATGDRRVALIASADHGHGHSDGRPVRLRGGVGARTTTRSRSSCGRTASATSSASTHVGRRRQGGQLLAAPDAPRRDRRRRSSPSSSPTRRRRTSGC